MVGGGGGGGSGVGVFFLVVSLHSWIFLFSFLFPFLFPSTPPSFFVPPPSNPSHSDLLEATRIILRDVPHVNRVVYNLSGTAAPTSFTSLAATMTKDRLGLLRECDHFVMEGLRRHNLYDSIWQCPTAMVPMSIDGKGTELVVVRPVHTKRAMTARPASFPSLLIEELRREVLVLDGVSGLCLDLTSKPPGTIEWE